MSEFLAMGGYAAYVWPAFGFALALMLGLLGQSWHAAHRREAELEQLRRLVRAGRARPGSTVREDVGLPQAGAGSGAE